MRLLFLSFLFVQSMAVSATNPDLERGLTLAKSDILVGEVDEGIWAAFLKYAYENPIPSTEGQPAFEKLKAQRKSATYFREQITALFEAWLRAKAIAEATHVDDDFREEHGLPDSAAPSPARSGVGGAGGAGRGSVVSGTHRTAFSRGFSIGASTMVSATDQVTGLLEQLRKLGDGLETARKTSYYAGKFSRAFGERFDPDMFIQALTTAGVDWDDSNAVQKASTAFLVQSVFSYALSAFETDDEALTVLTDRGVSCEKSQEENGKIVHSVRKEAVIKYVEDLLEEGLVTIDLSVFRDRREFVDLAIGCGLAPRSKKPLSETLEGMGRVAQIKYGGELYDTY